MKTTIELPDALFRRAKAEAANRGISLKVFITDAVERGLRERSSSSQPTWKGLHGQLAALRRETARIRSRIDDEFERVDGDDD